MESYFELKAIAWLSGDERDRSGARRRPGPALAWFYPWSSIGGLQVEVNFIGRLALERRVGTMLVVPSKVGCEFPAKRRLALRNHDLSSCLVLDGANQSFDHSDASVLPDRAVPNTDRLALAPAFEGGAAENTALVAD